MSYIGITTFSTTTIFIIGVLLLCIGIMLVWNNPFRSVYINQLLQSKQQRKIEQFINKRNKLEKTPTVLNPLTPSPNVPNLPLIARYASLFYMYKDGVPDKYNSNGDKIKGIEPDAYKAIEQIKLGVRCGWGRWGLLELAMLLHYGIHNFDPDLEKARDLYKYIIRTTRDSRLKKEALEKYQEIDYNINQLKVYDWLNIEPPTNDTTTTTVTQDQRIDTSTVQSPVTQAVLQNLHINRTQPVDIHEVIQEANNQDGEHITMDETPDFPEQPQIQIKNDMQNVHDSTLLSTIRKSIANLQKAVTVLPLQNVLIQIRKYIRSKPNNDKRRDAMIALNAVERNTVPLSSTHLKEVDALQLVWSRIASKTDQETRDQLKQCLYTQLSECIEHGKPVCSTGRFTRIIDSLNVLDKLVTIKPTFAVQQEMMNKCAMIREQLYDDLSEQHRTIIDNDLEETNDITQQFSKTFKSTIRNQLKKDYVDTGIWKQEKLDKELNKWIDFI